MKAPARIQVHVALAYRHEPASEPRIAARLARGWRIVELQRLTDRDALVTLEMPPGDAGSKSA